MAGGEWQLVAETPPAPAAHRFVALAVIGALHSKLQVLALVATKSDERRLPRLLRELPLAPAHRVVAARTEARPAGGLELRRERGHQIASVEARVRDARGRPRCAAATSRATREQLDALRSLERRKDIGYGWAVGPRRARAGARGGRVPDDRAFRSVAQ